MPKDFRLIPERYRVLSGSVLKVIAVVTMLIDHTAVAQATYLSGIELLALPGKSLTVYQAMRDIGRIAFPIFCFLLVEGFDHTHDRRAYGIRLALFALISEVPWNLFHCNGPILPGSQNVFFTLLLSYVALCILEECQKAEDANRRWRMLLALLGVFLLACVARTDYGARGMGLVLSLHLLRQIPLVRAIVASACDGAVFFSSLAFIPIGMYNGERGFIRGRVLQLLFYAIYPVHMLILWALSFHVFG